MALPVFYEVNLSQAELFPLSEITSKHVIQVLRMKRGEHIMLTNGQGVTHLTELVNTDKRSADVRILSTSTTPKPLYIKTIAISPVKNKGRFEWFLEKATEIGVDRIIPLVCSRSEGQAFRYDRMQSILISAMLQSQRSWLPELTEPVKFEDLISSTVEPNRFIAHCMESERKLLSKEIMVDGDRILLIGPEGDFTETEVSVALKHKFLAVSLGANRLRTETAGMVGCVLLQ